jgi:ribosomal 50S subunit-recycling heat shock protein
MHFALSPLPFAFRLMRLDLFLKLSRLCPRRALAQELCDAGFVLLNGRTAKSAHSVKAGDEITIRRRNRVMTARVLIAPATSNVSRRDASQLIEVLGEKRFEPFSN